MERLKGKTVIVTGGAGGIGRAAKETGGIVREDVRTDR